MNPLSAGIYSDRGDLVARLRESCPEWTFLDDTDARESCRVAVVDAGLERREARA